MNILIGIYWAVALITSIVLGFYNWDWQYGAAIYMGFGIVFMAIGSLTGDIPTPKYNKE